MARTYVPNPAAEPEKGSWSEDNLGHEIHWVSRTFVPESALPMKASGRGWAGLPGVQVKGCEVAPTLEITRLPDGSHIFHRLSRPLVERIVGDTKIGVSVHARGPCYLSTSVRFGSQAVDPCNRCMTPFQWGQLFVPPSGTNLE